MTQWALQKHKGYVKEYGDEYKKLRRKAIVPFVI
jgi:very-long-chain enoyl-CoA reductase